MMSFFIWLRDLWYWFCTERCGDSWFTVIGRWDIEVEQIGREDAPFWQAGLDAHGEAHYSRIGKTPFQAFRAGVAFASAHPKLEVDFEV